MSQFTERLNHLIESSGVKKKDLSALLNVSSNTFQYYLTGKLTPNANQLVTLSRFFDVSIGYLVGVEEEPRKPPVSQNPLYAGMVRYGYRDVSGHRRTDPLIAPGQHEAIIDTATWERSEAVWMRRRTMPNRSGTGTYPFTGLLRCGLCGASMYGRTTVNKTKSGQTEHRHYMCVERMHTRLCEMPMVCEQQLESMVMEEISRWRDDIIQMDMDVSEQNKSASHRKKFERDMQKVENHRQRFMDAYADDNMTSAELRGQLDRITNAIKASELPQEAVLNVEAIKDILTAFQTA